MLVRDLMGILKKAPQDKQVEIVDFEGFELTISSIYVQGEAVVISDGMPPQQEHTLLYKEGE